MNISKFDTNHAFSWQLYFWVFNIEKSMFNNLVHHKITMFSCIQKPSNQRYYKNLQFGNKYFFFPKNNFLASVDITSVYYNFQWPVIFGIIQFSQNRFCSRNVRQHKLQFRIPVIICSWNPIKKVESPLSLFSYKHFVNNDLIYLIRRL